MGDAARALDDVSDHLGEVLRRADDLLAEWSRFGAQVHAQVEREAAAIGEVVESAVGRVAASGVDRAIADRLRALTGELERLEQRARAAARVAADQRDRDRRLLWAVIAGIVLANALLVVLVLRRPVVAPSAAEPVRLEAASVPASAPEASSEPAALAGDGAGGSAAAGGSGAGSGLADGSAGIAVGTAGAGAPAPAPGKPSASSGAAQRGSAPASEAGSGAAGRSAEGSRPATRAGEAGGGRGADAAAGGAGRSADGVRSSPIALPPKPAASRAHKKLP